MELFIGFTVVIRRVRIFTRIDFIFGYQRFNSMNQITLFIIPISICLLFQISITKFIDVPVFFSRTPHLDFVSDCAGGHSIR